MGVPETPPTQAIFGKRSIDLKTAVKLVPQSQELHGKPARKPWLSSRLVNMGNKIDPE